MPAVMTVLNQRAADAHEHRDPTCLYAPDGHTTCRQPAAWRHDLAPPPGFDGRPVTFTCAEHGPHVTGLTGTTTRGLEP